MICTGWMMDRCDVTGSASHFLDSLACLFLGGAHFKHIVSTVKETRRHESVLQQQFDTCDAETGTWNVCADL